MAARLFTPETARVALDTIRPAAETMCRLARRMDRRKPPQVRCDDRVEPTYFQMVQGLLHALAVLEHAGVQVKDLRGGLLDFPARRGGRAVLLCWKLGEPGIAFWHDAESGFAGRRPLDEGPWDDA